MSFDLTDKNIQDTFQNLLQKTGSDGRLYDLVGNQVRDLTIDGTLTANTYITSQSIVNTSSGSTAFGNDANDSHTFQGHITASGNISGSKDTDLTIGGKMTLVGSDGDGLIMNANEPIISLNPGGSATARIGYTEKSIRLNNSSLSFSTVGHLVVSSSGLTTADALVGVGVEKPASTLDVGGNINTNSHITASGHISGSSTSTIQVGGNITTDGVGTFGTRLITSDIRSSGDLVTVNDDLSVNGHITASGNISSSVAVSGSGGNYIGNRRFNKTSNTDAHHLGDVVYFGGTTGMTAGRIYHYKSDGTWEDADPNAASTSDGLLGVALGGNSDVDGMLLRGTVTLDHNPGAVGDVLYLNEAAAGGVPTHGRATDGAPAGNGDIVRVIGYCLDGSNGQIYFNPDNTFVEVSA